MKKLYMSLFTSLLCVAVQAQTTPKTQDFGKVDKADLELKSCEFEPDANAEVLFDKANVYFDQEFNIVNERHKRIKIFNDNGKKSADIRIDFFSGGRLEYITGLQAQTINLVDGKVEITKIDKKLIFTEHTDKMNSALVFSLPNVKAGSVIEYKYTWTTVSYNNFPDWYFQGKIPVRYSEIKTNIPEYFYYKIQSHLKRAFTVSKNSQTNSSIGAGASALTFTVEVEQRGLDNIHSLPDEPYMSSDIDNLESMAFVLTSIRPINGFTQSRADTWPKIGGLLADDEDFGKQLKRKLAGEEVLVTKAKQLRNDDQKIAYLFNEVRNSMKKSGTDKWYTNDGTVKAWEKKIGNATEINLILYHLLKQSGVKSYPMIVSTRDNGRVNPFNAFVHQFNRGVVFIPVDSTKYYVLDASDKYNLYNEVPDNLLNSSALYIDKEENVYDMLFIENKNPVRQSYFTKASITPDGKMSGTIQISNYSYNKIKQTARYKRDGEAKYIDYLRANDNNLKITALKAENLDVDTLPLNNLMNFETELTGSDGNYIYLNPNLITPLHANPFISEERFTDIEFGYRDNYTIAGMFNIPAGFKVESLPKAATIVMPDKSMTFRRVINQSDQTIVVRFVVDHSQTLYFKDTYEDFREFYRQMFEMLNEQIVLKKA